jgi:hypothetical protein
MDNSYPDIQLEEDERRPEWNGLGAGIDFSNPRSALAPYYGRASHVVATLFLACIFVVLNYVPLWHTDVWGHLKFGQWIWQHGTLPRGDPFCPYAEPSSPSIGYCWLSQVGFYAVYHLGAMLGGAESWRRMEGGVELLRFAYALLTTLRLLVLLAAFRRLTSSLPLACAGVAIVLVSNLSNIGIFRPQVVGEFLYACLLLALSGEVISRRAAIVVPVLLILWANAHGSFVIGLMLLAGCLAGRVVEIGLASQDWSLRHAWADLRVRRLLRTLGAGSVAIALVNPAGPRIFWNTYQMATQPNVNAMDEWQPLNFHLGPGGHWAYLATLVLLFGTHLRARLWFKPTALVLMVLFGLQPLWHQRSMVWWLALVPWLVLPYWPEIGRRLSWNWLRFRSVPSFRKTILAAMVVLAAMAWSIPVQWALAGGPRPFGSIVSAGTPWKVTAELTATDQTGGTWVPGLRQVLDQYYPRHEFTGGIFASETLGDYFIWSLAPRTPVFVYTHVHLLPPSHWRLCMLVRSGAPECRSILDGYHTNLVVVEPVSNPRLIQLLKQDADWVVVLDETELLTKRDKRTRLFVAVRKHPSNPKS